MSKTAIFCALLLAAANADSEDLFLAEATYLDSTELTFFCSQLKPTEVCFPPSWNRYKLEATSLESGETSTFVAAFRHTHQHDTSRPWLVAIVPTADHPERKYIEAKFVITYLDVADEFFCPPDGLLPPSVEPDVSTDDGPRCYSKTRLLELAR